jgi:hypothetical protein
VQNHAAVLMDVKMEKYKNLWEESDFYRREINGGSLQFDRRDIEVLTAPFCAALIAMLLDLSWCHILSCRYCHFNSVEL